MHCAIISLTFRECRRNITVLCITTTEKSPPLETYKRQRARLRWRRWAWEWRRSPYCCCWICICRFSSPAPWVSSSDACSPHSGTSEALRSCGTAADFHATRTDTGTRTCRTTRRTTHRPTIPKIYIRFSRETILKLLWTWKWYLNDCLVHNTKYKWYLKIKQKFLKCMLCFQNVCKYVIFTYKFSIFKSKYA